MFLKNNLNIINTTTNLEKVLNSLSTKFMQGRSSYVHLLPVIIRQIQLKQVVNPDTQIICKDHNYTLHDPTSNLK